MIDLFNVSNQTLIQRLDNLAQLKERCANDAKAFMVIRDGASGAQINVSVETVEPIIREQLILVQDELRRRFG